MWYVIWLWFLTNWAYVAIMCAKSIEHRMTLYWKVILWPLVIIGVLLDIAFNWTFGTAAFLERPMELLFTDRVQRHFYARKGWRHHVAAFFAKQLNVVDPTHV